MSPRRLVPLALVLVSASCGRDARFGMPDSVTEQGDEILGLWRGSVLAGMAVAALVWALVVWSVLRYRRRNDDLPSQTPENIPVEIAYTVTPLVIVAVLFGFTLATQGRLDASGDEPDLTVEVVGFQWSWEFRYPDQGVVVRSDGVDPPRLVVPVGRTVRFELRTTDVNHAFWVPEFLVKRDLIPNVDNEIDVDVTEAGVWRGRCAEFCGLEHWRMLFDLEAVPADEFDARLAEVAEAAA